jgi:hypothetical protein
VLAKAPILTPVRDLLFDVYREIKEESGREK